jgi:hypothetical protein
MPVKKGSVRFRWRNSIFETSEYFLKNKEVPLLFKTEFP